MLSPLSPRWEIRDKDSLFLVSVNATTRKGSGPTLRTRTCAVWSGGKAAPWKSTLNEQQIVLSKRLRMSQRWKLGKMMKVRNGLKSFIEHAVYSLTKCEQN